MWFGAGKSDIALENNKNQTYKSHFLFCNLTADINNHLKLTLISGSFHIQLQDVKGKNVSALFRYTNKNSVFHPCAEDLQTGLGGEMEDGKHQHLLGTRYKNNYIHSSNTYVLQVNYVPNTRIIHGKKLSYNVQCAKRELDPTGVLEETTT